MYLKIFAKQDLGKLSEMVAGNQLTALTMHISVWFKFDYSSMVTIPCQLCIVLEFFSQPCYA